MVWDFCFTVAGPCAEFPLGDVESRHLNRHVRNHHPHRQRLHGALFSETARVTASNGWGSAGAYESIVEPSDTLLSHGSSHAVEDTIVSDAHILRQRQPCLHLPSAAQQL